MRQILAMILRAAGATCMMLAFADELSTEVHGHYRRMLVHAVALMGVADVCLVAALFVERSRWWKLADALTVLLASVAIGVDFASRYPHLQR